MNVQAIQMIAIPMRPVLTQWVHSLVLAILDTVEMVHIVSIMMSVLLILTIVTIMLLVQIMTARLLVPATLDIAAMEPIVKTLMSAHQTPPPITVLPTPLVLILMDLSPVLVMKVIQEMALHA